MVGLWYLRVPQSCGVQGLRDEVTLSGRVCVPLYVPDRNEGFSLNRAEVPWSSLVLSVQGLRNGVTLRGRVCVSAYVLDRIVGFLETLFSSSFAMRSPLGSSLRISVRTRSKRRLSLGLFWVSCSFAMGSPFWVECPYFCMCSIGTKVFLGFFLI